MQSLEGLDPRSKLSGASQVTLSEAEVRALRRDMQEQENLIQGYQVTVNFTYCFAPTTYSIYFCYSCVKGQSPAVHN